MSRISLKRILIGLGFVGTIAAVITKFRKRILGLFKKKTA